MCETDSGEKRLVSLKVLYTLHGVASQKFVVKPVDQVEARVFDAADLGIVALKPCLEAIRHSSPDYAEICDSNANDYAIYSVDYAEEGLPLQGHGRVSEHVLREVTGKLKPSKLLREQLELQIHLLPIRVPQEMPYEVPPDQSDFSLSQGLSSRLPQSLPKDKHADAFHPDDSAPRRTTSGSNLMYDFPSAPASLGFDMHFPPMPSLPESLSGSRSDTFLPSSPPVRARPTKIATSSGTVAPRRVNPMADMTPAKRPISESSSTSGSKKKKQASPGSSHEAACGNCGVASASTWRRVKLDQSLGGDILLCNACGLYYKTKNIMRPSFLWDRNNRLANRIQDPQPVKPSSSKLTRRNSPSSQEPALSLAGIDSASQTAPEAPETSSQDAVSEGSSPSLPIQPVIAEPQSLQPPLSISKPGSAKAEDTEEPPNTETQHPLQLHLPEPPSTPPRGNNQASDSQQVPSSIEKLFLVTPEGKKTINIHLPGSGSAGKWLNRMMNPTEESSYFESFLASPTPKKNPSVNKRQGDSPICSSPPTSSTLFSEIPDWSIFPTSPTPPKMLTKPERSKAEEAGEAKDEKHQVNMNAPPERI